TRTSVGASSTEKSLAARCCEATSNAPAPCLNAQGLQSLGVESTQKKPGANLAVGTRRWNCKQTVICGLVAATASAAATTTAGGLATPAASATSEGRATAPATTTALNGCRAASPSTTAAHRGGSAATTGRTALDAARRLLDGTAAATALR